MITLDELRDMESHTVFATGISNDERIFSQPVRWVAKRGYIHDWAIYYDKEEKSVEDVMRWGNKLYSRNIVKDLVECDEAMMKMYRD